MQNTTKKYYNYSKPSARCEKNSNPQCPNITFEIIVQEHQFCKEAVEEIRKALEVYLEKPKNKNSKE